MTSQNLSSYTPAAALAETDRWEKLSSSIDFDDGDGHRWTPIGLPQSSQEATKSSGEIECRARKLIYQKCDILHASRGTCQGIKCFKTTQRKEDINRLVERFAVRNPLTPGESLSNHTYPPPPPFISRPYHRLEIRVQGSQCPQPAHHEPIHVPEVTKDQQILLQSVHRLRLAECSSHLLHATTSCHRIT